MLTRALGYGAQTMRRHLGLAVLAWAVGAAIAGLSSLPVWFWFGAAATRPDADGLLQRLDPGTMVDLMIGNGPAAFTGVIGATLLSLVIAAIAGVLVNAGLVAAVVTPDGRPAVSRFLAGAGAYFLRFLRLAVVAAITGALMFVLILAGAALLARTVLAGASFTGAAMWLTLVGGAFLITSAIVFMAMDYARIQLAVTDSRKALRAWRASLRFVFRHPLSTLTLALAFSAIAVAALLAYTLIGAPTSMLGIALLFVIRQTVVFVRVAARIGLLGAEHELWRTSMPSPPPQPAPIAAPEPPSARPPDLVDASI